MLMLLENDRLKVTLAAAHTTNPLSCLSTYRDCDAASNVLVMSRNLVDTNGTIDVNLIESPVGSLQRLVAHISIYNNDTANHVVTISYDNNGTVKTLLSCELITNYTLQYESSTGWRVLPIAPTVFFD